MNEPDDESPIERRSRRRRDWFVLAGQWACIACVIAMSLLVLNQDARISDQQHDVARQQHALGSISRSLAFDAQRLASTFHQEVEACNRLQILRVEDNVSHYADYRVYRVVYVESLVARRLASSSMTRFQRRYEDRFLTELRGAIHDKTWTPLTDCAQAVTLYGAAYKPPRPVAFYKRLPPASALVIPPAALR